MLLAVSLLALAPTLTIADAQKQIGTIGINATGQGTSIGKGKGTSSFATLVLKGGAQSDGNGELKLNGLTGFLLIGSVNYTITGGQGDVSNKGKTEINGKTKGGDNKNDKNELVLHGTLQGTNVAFDSHESKLSSLYSLTLTGQANLTVNSTNSKNQQDENDNENEGEASTQTATLTSFVTLNNTVTKTQLNNQTITQTVTEPTNITVTTTKSLNQTITVTKTETIANTTITNTVTTTVANTTITTTLSGSTTGP